MPTVICKICSGEFYSKPSQIKLGWGKYCSSECRSKAQFNGKFVVCSVCKAKIYRSKARLKHSVSGKYFCSKKCQTLWRNSIYIEDRSKNWLNGASAYRRIMDRRDFIVKCVRCGFDDKRALVIHHIDHVRTNNSLDNLVCLCLNCHHLIHHYEDIDNEMLKAKF